MMGMHTLVFRWLYTCENNQYSEQLQNNTCDYFCSVTTDELYTKSEKPVLGMGGCRRINLYTSFVPRPW